ncbi:hypothetical protein M3Y97_00771800 [Aphelenchoides bicaudatus]|nr:hypothetical protein M3Y97_00771800 [Aphelenchoides bicaudatus]
MLKRVAVLLLVLAPIASAQWPRWEERTLDCKDVKKTDQCLLVAPKAKVARDPGNYKCFREPMPKNDWNQYSKNVDTRLACPIACEPDADLSVIQKRPILNKDCQKYYTYGKFRKNDEWFLWISEPCLSSVEKLTTHCRYKDIPLFPGDKPTDGKQPVDLAASK